MYRLIINRIALIITFVVMVFTGVRCSLENPVAPSWETDINIPLIKSNTYISDFLAGKGQHKDGLPLPVSLETTSIIGDIKQVDVSAIKGMVTNGVIKYDLENRLAIGVDTALIYISRDSNTVYESPEFVIGPLTVDAAETDSSGNVIQAKTTKITITLGEKEMGVLTNDNGSVFVGYYLVTSGTNGKPVKIQPTDYLKTSVLVTVRAKVN